jgi:hypothetical protein
VDSLLKIDFIAKKIRGREGWLASAAANASFIESFEALTFK